MSTFRTFTSSRHFRELIEWLDARHTSHLAMLRGHTREGETVKAAVCEGRLAQLDEIRTHVERELARERKGETDAA